MPTVQHYATNYLENVKVILISQVKLWSHLRWNIASLVDMSKSCPLMDAP